MHSNNSIKCSEISDGQYTVSIDLRGIHNSDKLKGFKKKIKELSNDCDGDTSGIYKFDGNILSYKSEQLIPTKKNNRPSLLLVLGNPATHSVESGMFFSFERNRRVVS
jgi:hypothetical protein